MARGRLLRRVGRLTAFSHLVCLLMRGIAASYGKPSVHLCMHHFGTCQMSANTQDRNAASGDSRVTAVTRSICAPLGPATSTDTWTLDLLIRHSTQNTSMAPS